MPLTRIAISPTNNNAKKMTNSPVKMVLIYFSFISSASNAGHEPTSEQTKAETKTRIFAGRLDGFVNPCFSFLFMLGLVRLMLYSLYFLFRLLIYFFASSSKDNPSYSENNSSQSKAHQKEEQQRCDEPIVCHFSHYEI
jgi:hypothetical protein